MREIAFILEIVDANPKKGIAYRKASRTVDVELINPDVHSTRELLYCQYGINMSRKGWLEKKDVLNTLNAKEMINFLKVRSYAEANASSL